VQRAFVVEINLKSGLGPNMSARLTLGKYTPEGSNLIHWIAVAWEQQGASGHIVDYAAWTSPATTWAEKALMVTLRELRDLAQEGWPVGSPEGEHMSPHQSWVDAGYMTPVVYAFCRETNKRFAPAIGRGAEQQHRQWYNRPTKTGSIVKQIGEGFHNNWMPSDKLHLVEVDADHWKSFVHQRLATPTGSPGAMTLFRASPQELLALAKHLTAERRPISSS
jgi:hypothetical protein